MSKVGRIFTMTKNAKAGCSFLFIIPLLLLGCGTSTVSIPTPVAIFTKSPLITLTATKNSEPVGLGLHISYISDVLQTIYGFGNFQEVTGINSFDQSILAVSGPSTVILAGNNDDLFFGSIYLDYNSIDGPGYLSFIEFSQLLAPQDYEEIVDWLMDSDVIAQSKSDTGVIGFFGSIKAILWGNNIPEEGIYGSGLSLEFRD